GLLEVLLQMLGLGAPTAGHNRPIRPVPALDHANVHLGRAGDHAVEGGARHFPQAAAARRLAVRDEAGRRAGGVEEPERAGASGRASAGSGATAGGSCANSLPARARRNTAKAAASGGTPSSSAAAVTAARASPGSKRCSTATATTASPRKSSAAPCPQPSARR